jgi:hypothetical protein
VNQPQDVEISCIGKTFPGSHKDNFAKVWISLAHETLSYDTKMLLKVIIDNTAFVKFKIRNNFKQNFDKNIQSKQKSIGKSIPA